MNCRYCGNVIKEQSAGFSLRTDRGDRCDSSPSGKHIAVSDGRHCVYCGEEVRNDGIQLRSRRSATCNCSPNRKHALDK